MSMNVKVAEKVMGLAVSGRAVVGQDGYRSGIPGYFSDMNATAQVVEKVAEWGLMLEMQVKASAKGNLKCVCTIYGPFMGGWELGRQISKVEAETMPEAICAAALAAAEKLEQEGGDV